MRVTSDAGGGPGAEILRILEQGRPGTTMCPSDVARKLDKEDWRALLPMVRAVAYDLAAAGLVDVMQRGRVIEGHSARGPIRLRLRRENTPELRTSTRRPHGPDRRPQM